VDTEREKEEWSWRQGSLDELCATFADEWWWKGLTPEQERQALDALKEANKIVFARLGLTLELVSYHREG